VKREEDDREEIRSGRLCLHGTCSACSKIINMKKGTITLVAIVLIATTVISVVMSTAFVNTTNGLSVVNNTELTTAISADTTPPTIMFVPPTPENSSEIRVNYVFVNVTVEDESEISKVWLNWNGSNETMLCAGYMNFHLNKTGLEDGVYVYRVYGDDIYGNVGVSEIRIVKVRKQLCGDVNCDRAVDMSDVIDLLYYVGYPGQYTICNHWAADVNCDKRIDMSDVIDLLYYVGYPGQYELKCCCIGISG